MAYIVKIDDKEFKCEVEKKEKNYRILLDGKEIQAEVVKADKESLTLIINNKPYQIYLHEDNQLMVNTEGYSYEVIDEKVARVMKSGTEVLHKKEAVVTAPMPGLVIEVEVQEGDAVKKGQGLLIVEAMKMQNEMKSPRDGVVKKILVQKGQTVNSRDTLIIIE